MSFFRAFTFSHSQKKGMMGLMACSILVICGLYLYRTSEPSPESLPAFPPELIETLADASDSIYINQADSAQWASLPGIGPVLSRRIVRYRNRLQGFDSVAQLKKVYGLQPEVFDQIQPLLVLDSPPHKINSPIISPSPNTHTPQKSTPSSRRLDINQADSAKWASLPGIGPVLSSRIVRFRKLKKGFQQVEDLQQVYGLSPETYQQIRSSLYVDTNSLQRFQGAEKSYAHRSESPSISSHSSLQVNVNTADSAALVQVPGIGPKLAPRIIKFRNILGFYASVEMLQHVYGMYPDNFERMKPYLIVGAVSEFPKRDMNTVSPRLLTYYPFLKDGPADSLVVYRKRLRRFDYWEEIAEIPGIDSLALHWLKTYFTL